MTRISEKKEVKANFLPDTKFRMKRKINAFDCYYDFLESVAAIKRDKGGITVMYFKNESIDKYYKKHVTDGIADVNLPFLFEESVINTRAESYGQKIVKEKTGWFTPRAFWDFIKGS